VFLVLWLVTFRERPITAFTHSWVVQYFGKTSYGTYLLHVPVMSGLTILGDKLSIPWLAYGDFMPPGGSYLKTALILVTSYAAATVSWYLLEEPAMRLKDRWAPSTAKAEPPKAPPATVSPEVEGPRAA
jgi:peptidoglycan/LPS O-acetylase OafA/YrhL